MQNIKKYFMTLALLLTAVGGAWAQSSPKVYTTQVSVEDLQVGDILAQGFSLVNNGSEKGFYFDKNRYKLNGGISSDDWHDLISDITSYGENCTISIRSTGHPDNVFTPVDENGNDGNAWVVTKIDNGKPYISGITAEITEWDLTSQDGKAWTLAKMPGSDIELQVEYYAESNIFLGKEALADKANIAVKNGETAVEFDDEGKSTTTVSEGNTVTAKFTGKKVIGMTVTKRASLVYPIAISEVTSDYIGSVVTTDGDVYATVAAAEAASKTPVAMIAYVGTESDCAHGLAIALAAESGTKDFGAAGTACSGKAAVTGGTWRLPSEKDWQYMFIGCGSSESYSAPTIGMSKNFSGLASKLTTGQGDALQTFRYWSSTEYNPGSAWLVFFDGSSALFYDDYEDQEYPVRACLAF